MISDIARILIHRFLDGEITPDEKTLLDKELADDADNRKYFEEMRSVDKQLKDDAKNTHSIDIADQLILKIIERNQKAAQSPKFSLKNHSTILTNSRIRFAIAFVSGAAACLIILFSFFDFGESSKMVPFDALSGAMVPQGNSSNSTKILTSQQATVEIHQSKLQEGFIQLDVSQNSTGLINVEFAFDAGNFQVFGLRPLEQGISGSISATLNSVIIKSSGNARFVFLLKQLNRLETNVTIKVFSEEGVLLNNDILLFK